MPKVALSVQAEDLILYQDYANPFGMKERSPYARIFQKIGSNERVMEISGLPMVDANGYRHELLWSDKIGKFENGNNIFHAIVDRGNFQLIALSDQPTGVKKDDDVSYHPQLYVGGVEVLPISDKPKLLETDPINENYHYNTLEWDYGVCIRRVRQIEGRFLGSWVFSKHPHNDIRIKYNQIGKIKLKLAYKGKSEDEEYIPASYFDRPITGWPMTVFDSAPFYPDAHPESTSVDGHVGKDTDNMTWATIHDATVGDLVYDSVSTLIVAAYLFTGTNNNTWYALYRGAFLFNTSSLPDDANITGAVKSVSGQSKADAVALGINTNIYTFNPASNTAIVVGDYTKTRWGTTPLCDTPIAYSGWSTAGYNNFTLNAAGLAVISKTSITKLGMRNAQYDVADTAPAWNGAGHDSHLFAYPSEKGNGYKPTLVVTYTTPGPHPIIGGGHLIDIVGGDE